ncbi:CDP-glycerol:poly(glycerophosphate) glycerophosphotransferase [Streptococcus oralis SK255]|jgi:CDP-glycerol:poly(glycerophosphate) glycerophosphotransferase|uniref:CDP-glycerol:poly(Glycerophosphate) glycerophosphotransferase n=1 Tax=Streptococcus oralis SK255 TaxID=1005704 RepID=F5VVZ4_STROR|nr:MULTISPECIES: CDP-glycerol glycerophosphotransferase family protein [Streptococcus]EFM35183.1 CDP-glycerol:poly(glycerophosphate) glycerophosphotransferase [Streptococcus sp. oral taxon 071 str. 73H25AP]EGL87783.1 CDP-glycerol:poly(glycerophosphate) glycerophosphotransferase [Streptococcus oralis SK255]MCY7078019.1 CDP-glycerol glycerophosphotransferase family protein [Streptococcus oralis]
MKRYYKLLLKRLMFYPFSWLPLNKRKLVFDNFGGRGYGDNPKYIADELLKQDKNLDIVWLTKDMSTSVPDGVRKVRYGSWRAFLEWSTAKIWVDNIRNSDRPWKRKKQIYLQTWHGSDGVKLVEKDVESTLSKSYLVMAKYDGRISDGIISSCQLQTEQFKKSFWLDDNVEILEYGLPRNDDFFYSEKVSHTNQIVRARYNISLDELVVLYMPTFRDNGSTKAYNLDYDKVISSFQKFYNKEVRVLIRFHPNVDNTFFKNDDERLINVTDYPDPQDLMFAADIMISDYSSAPIDFMLLNRTIFLYMPDYEEYTKLRPLNPNFNNLPFIKCYTNLELVEQISRFSKMDYHECIDDYKLKNRRFDDGDAARKCAEWIVNQL